MMFQGDFISKVIGFSETINYFFDSRKVRVSLDGSFRQESILFSDYSSMIELALVSNYAFRSL
jgi:hypothetical protein